LAGDALCQDGRQLPGRGRNASALSMVTAYGPRSRSTGTQRCSVTRRTYRPVRTPCRRVASCHSGER
jgi:hypothetical protein